MIRRPGFVDTISGWMAVNIVIAIAISVGLNALFMQFAGVWARPDFPHGGLGARVAATVRMIDRMPQSVRPALAKAAATSEVSVAWYPDAARLPIPVQQAYPDGAALIRRLLKRPDARVVGYAPGPTRDGYPPINDYELAVSLSDGSWVLFRAPERVWGLDPTQRALVIGLFVLASTLLVALIASRRLARPMKQVAGAARRFSTDIQAREMPPSGPREFRQAIDAFNTMQARIQRFVTDRNEMLTAISHDLRAPLTRLRLRGEFIDDADQRQRLFRDVDEMQHMINAALRFFRDETDPETPTRIDLSELIHTVLEDFGNQSALTFDGPPHQVAYGRPHALRRALVNIVDNALKYGDAARVRLAAVDDHLQLTVEDEGPGIPEDQHAAVFRPFFRLESSRNRRTGGVGLGLGSARSIVRAHGGELMFENVRPRGLRVVIKLPATV